MSDRKPANAFITARKGFCYLTIKSYGRNHEMMRVRAYKIEPEEKRDMRRLYPDVVFDWKKITQQLAEKREVCRRYRTRSRRRVDRRAGDDTFRGVYDPGSRTIFTDGIPTTSDAIGRLLDAVLQLDRLAAEPPLVPAPTQAQPKLTLIRGGKVSKPESSER